MAKEGASSEIRKEERARTSKQIEYTLRVLVLLTGLGVVIWVYGGDFYVAAVLVGSALGVFAAGIAPGLIPAIVRYVVMMPFVLGGLIPIWRLLDAVFRWELDPILRALGVLVAYAIAALMVIRLPVRMRAPFVDWLPKGAIPSAEAEALRREARDRQEAARRAERERADREKQSAREADEKRKQAAREKAAREKATREKKAKPAAAESKSKKGFGWGRGKTAEADKPAASKPATGGVNPFFKAPAASAETATPEESGAKKKGFGWGRGKTAEADPPAASQPATGGVNPFFKAPAAGAETSTSEESGDKKKGFGWGRGKTAEADQPAASQPVASSPFYNAYEDDYEDEPEEDIDGTRYDWGSRYDPPGLSRVNPFAYADDEDDDDDDDLAGGFSWSSASDPDPDDAPEDELLEKIRAMRKTQPKW